MKVRVLYFAAARERAGVQAEEVEVPDGATAAALLEALGQRHPALLPLLPHLRVAANQAFVQLDQPLPHDAEMALLPPVSGGSGAFQVVDRPLTLDDVLSKVEGTAQGGVVTFTGRVRDHTRGRAVQRLEYEAYVPMAEQVLAAIGQEVAERWPGTRLAIFHRVGVLSPGEAAVVIAAASAHRREAFLGCEHAIERLKTDAPIWKKEVFADGEVWVGLGP